MRPNHVRPARSSDLRRLFERLDALPLRPETARWVLDQAERPEEDAGNGKRAGTARSLPTVEIDPGWVLARMGAGDSEPLAVVRDLPWWPKPDAATADCLARLWRHSVGMSLAARRLASETTDVDPTRVARAALLSNLGLWAWAVIDPASLRDWMCEADPEQRLAIERERFGRDHVAQGMALARRRSLDGMVVDAIWLQGVNEPTLRETPALQVIGRAAEIADRTPWALHPSKETESAQDPRIRLLIAEIQARCSGAFVDPEATPREEKLTRDNARLRLELHQTRAREQSAARFLECYAESRFGEEPESWAERAGLAWCDEPGVAAARVVWTDVEDPAKESPRPPSKILALGSPGATVAEVHLWSEAAEEAMAEEFPARAAWSAWANEVATQRRMLRRLEALGVAIRSRRRGETEAGRRADLAALAEFAAGAGHELNNPLAVILGRAQLLLAKQADPESIRSLRAIIAQAQRTNRILRDLMYFARPSDLREKLCQPDEIVRTSVRDLQQEAETRGVQLSAELRSDVSGKVWADPDALRQVADCLIRNALEWTPQGGRVVISSSGSPTRLDWTVKDSGRGLAPSEAIHLFDPFFCGRQAGRGLGLGLPRVARIIEKAGGRIAWNSEVGSGTDFQVVIPLPEPPKPVVEVDQKARPA